MAIFTGRRLYTNNVQGTTTDNPLTDSATTLNSAGLANLAAVSSNHAVLVLDPLRAAGAPEIVIVTAHTGSATSATITRGAYGTSARQHAAGTLWVHPFTHADVIQVLAANPSDNHEGQLWFRADTDIFMAHTGSATVEALPIGAWQTWSPTLTNLTVGSGAVTARYTRIGRTIHYMFEFIYGSGSAVGSGPRFTLPVPPADTTTSRPFGLVSLLDSGANTWIGQTQFISGSTVLIAVTSADGTNAAGRTITASVPFTWGTSDAIFVEGTYEAAS